MLTKLKRSYCCSFMYNSTHMSVVPTEMGNSLTDNHCIWVTLIY